MGVGSFDAAEIRALTRIGAGDEKLIEASCAAAAPARQASAVTARLASSFHDGPPGSMPIAVTIARRGDRPSGKVRRSRRRRGGDRRVDPDPHEERAWQHQQNFAPAARRSAAQRSSGIARVSYDGKTVDYRSVAEIDRAIEALDREIAAAEGRRIVRQVRVTTAKGL